MALESELRKKITNGVTVYEFAMNELFDPSTDEKLLRFFSTGNNEEQYNYTWVAVPRDGRVDEGTMFSGVGVDELRLNLENTLQEHCHPLTLGQKCADWFLMKVLVTGTVAGQVMNAVKNVDIDNWVEDNEGRMDTLRKCMDSWFKRHKSSSAMKIGTDNELPTFEALQ